MSSNEDVRIHTSEDATIIRFSIAAINQFDYLTSVYKYIREKEQLPRSILCLVPTHCQWSCRNASEYFIATSKETANIQLVGTMDTRHII